MTKSIYLCGGISGRSYDEVFLERHYLESIFCDRGFKVFNPMRDKYHLEGEVAIKSDGYKGNILTEPDGFFSRDYLWLKTSDIVFAYFQDTTEVSIGSCVEIGWARELNKTLVVVGDSNHNHPFIRLSADVYTEDKDKAIQYVLNLYN